MQAFVKTISLMGTILISGLGLAIATGPVAAGTIVTGAVSPFLGSGSNDVTGSDVSVAGNPGSLEVNGGSNLTADTLRAADNEPDVTFLNFTGAGTTVNLVGDNPGFTNRIDIGGRGSATMTISGGAVVDAASAPCTSGNCNIFVGNFTGSTGNLIITGAGSRLDGQDSFVLGQSRVTNIATEGFDAGIPGGTTNGTLNVLDGGVLNTETSFLARELGGPNALGTEQAIVNATVSGNGSQWNISGTNALLFIAAGDNSTATLDIESNGALSLDGTTANTTVLRVGRNGGTGVLNALNNGNILVENSSTGSAVLDVGRDAGSDGTLTANDGSTVSIATSGLGAGTSSINIGRDGSTGIATFDNSALTVGDFLSVGRNGTGILTLQNGAIATNTDAAGLTRIGREGGTGTLEVVSGSSLTANNLRLGSDTGSTGTVTVDSGATINLTDTVQVGQDSATANTLTIGAGGTVNAHTAIIATNTGSNGTANVSGAGAQLNLSGLFPTTGTDQDGAVLVVGRNGTGTLNINAGGTITIAPAPSFGTGLTGGLLIGGSSASPTGTGNGTVNVDGAGSSIVFSNANGQAGNTQVGRDGTGVLNITNGASVDGSTQGLAIVGRLIGSTGTVNVTGAGSSWATSSLFIGTDVDFGTVTASGPGGNGTVNVADGGTLSAGTIVNGTTGSITGGGGLIQGNILNSGTIGPGNSPGLMSVIGDVDFLSGGTLALELGGLVVDTGYDRLDIAGTATLEAGSIFDIDLFGGFTAGLGDTFDVLVADNISVVDLGALIFDFSGALLGSGLSWQASIIDGARDSLRLSVVQTEVAVTEPSTLPLFASLLLGVIGARRIQRRPAKFVSVTLE